MAEHRFLCPVCGGLTNVLDTRVEKGVIKRRRYRCLTVNCKTGFSTIEVMLGESIAQGDRRKLNIPPQNR